MDKVEFIARVRYLGWLCYQMGANLPLHDVPENFEISKERLESLMKGTEFVLKHLEITAKENHALWMKGKEEQGYTYGEVLDVVKKTHPSMIPYDDLLDVEKRKDDMDLLMIHLCEKLYNMLENN